MDLLTHSTFSHSAESAERAIIQLLIDALPSNALIIDPQGKVAALNLQAEIFLGWGLPLLEGQSVHEILECHAKSMGDSSGDCPILRLIGGEKVEPDGQMQVRCRDESLKQIQYRCTSYPTGKGVGAILAFHDMTREIEMEKDLRRLASIGEESPIAIVELNEDANLIHANPAMMALIERFGFSCDARPAILPPNIEVLTAHCLETQTDHGPSEVSLAGSHYEWKLVPVMRENLAALRRALGCR
jgi:PAS domain-containing protein